MVDVLVVPKSLAKYAFGAGMGDDGAYFPYSNLSKLAWRWTTLAKPGQPPVNAGGPPTGGSGFRLWAGDVHAGLHIKLKGKDEGWNRPTGDPMAGGKKKPAHPEPFPTWANGNSGGWKTQVGAESVQLIAYTGNHTILAGMYECSRVLLTHFPSPSPSLHVATFCFIC